MTRRALLVLVLGAAAGALGLGAPAAKAKAKAPPPYVDRTHGFQVKLPADWRTVGQDTGAGAREPVLKAARDAGGQWLVVLVEKGPTDDAAGQSGAEAIEAGFATAPGYQRLSLERREVSYTAEIEGVTKKAKLPAVDLWFVMQRDGQPVVVGVRALVYKSYLLTLVIDLPGKKKPDAATKRVLQSFTPA